MFVERYMIMSSNNSYHLHFYIFVAYETKHLTILSLRTILIVGRLKYHTSPCGNNRKILNFDTTSTFNKFSPTYSFIQHGCNQNQAYMIATNKKETNYTFIQ